jgi:O-antigen/teichoic acid export membrane protein
LVPSFAFLFVLTHGNKYLLEWKWGLDTVGLYSVGFNLGMAMSIVTGGVATAWYPFFMTFMERQEEAREVFGRVFTYYVFGVGSLCLVFFLAAKPAVMLLTQEPFHGAYVVLGLVALGNFFQTAANFFLPGLYYNKEVHYVSVVQGVSAVLSVPLNYWLIVQLGVLGSGIGFASSNALMTLLMYGWTILRGSRYPIVAHEWARVLWFALLAGVVTALYLTTPEAAFVGEVMKSILLGLLLLAGILLLLNKRERSFLIQHTADK